MRSTNVSWLLRELADPCLADRLFDWRICDLTDLIFELAATIEELDYLNKEREA